MLLFDTSYVQIRSVLSEIRSEFCYISLFFPVYLCQLTWHCAVSVCSGITAGGYAGYFPVKAESTRISIVTEL